MTSLVFKDYPYWEPKDEAEIKQQMREIANIRKDDITQINKLPGLYVGGRLVGKIPTSSADVSPDDRIGDVSRDNTSTYILQNVGAPQWIKYSGSTF